MSVSSVICVEKVWLLVKILEPMNVKLLSFGPPEIGSSYVTVAERKQQDRLNKKRREEFNSSGNKHGAKYSTIMLDARQFTEALSLHDVRHVILADLSEGNDAPSWSLARQRVARAIRRCSHKNLEASKRTLDVKIYLSVIERDGVAVRTVDQIKFDKLLENRRIITQAEDELSKVAIDYNLYPSTGDAGPRIRSVSSPRLPAPNSIAWAAASRAR